MRDTVRTEQDWRVDLRRADDLTVGDWARWRALRASNAELASPYFDPDFARAAAAASPGAAIAVFSRAGVIEGFFPHQRRGATLQPLGAPMNDYHGVIAAPGQAPTLRTVARLMEAPRLNVSAWVGPAEEGEPRSTLMVTMPDGYEAWYAERRRTWGKYFKDKERARRSLETEQGEITVEWGVTDPGMLDHLIGLKSAQYRRTGRHDIFACGWTRDLLHALMKRPLDGLAGSMAVMRAGGRLAAVEYALHGGGQYHFWFPAYEPELARCSPGILLSLDTMRLAAERSFTVFDFGFGGEGYKKYFCDRTQTVREAVIRRPGLTSNLGSVVTGAMKRIDADRATRLNTSLRRRWAAIEACETTSVGRARGAMTAARAAFDKLRAADRHPI